MVFFVWYYFYLQIQVQSVIFPDRCIIIEKQGICIDNIGLVIYNKDSSTKDQTYVSRGCLFLKSFLLS